MEQVKGNANEINLMISLLSTANKNFFDAKYVMTMKDGTQLFHENGLITNFPIIQLTRQKIAKTSGGLDHLFAICTTDTRNAMEITNIPECVDRSEVEWLKERFEETDDQEHGKTPELEIFDIPDDPNSKDTIETINDIRRKIEEIRQNDHNKKVNVYIDAQGGIRHVIFSVIMSVYIWERDGSNNIELKEIYNSNPKDKDEGRFKVKDNKERYNAVQLYSAIDEFINYGKSTALTSYMAPVLGRSIKDVDQDEQLKNDIQRCLDVMKFFSDDLQLCRSGKIAGDIKNFKEVTERFCDRYSGVEDYYITSFTTALEMIRKEFDALPEDADEVDIIKWCIDKDFIQQAITFCSERSIEYVLDGVIAEVGYTFSDEEIRKANSQSGEYSKRYTLVNRMGEGTSEKFCAWYENGRKPVKRKKLKEIWLNAEMNNEKVRKVADGVYNNCIKRVVDERELKILLDLINGYPFFSKRSVDNFLDRAQISKNDRKKCWFTDSNKEKNFYDLLIKKPSNDYYSRNKTYSPNDAAQKVAGYLAQKRKNRFLDEARREIKKYDDKTPEFERELGYLLFDKDDRETYHKERYYEWFYNRYFSELGDVIDDDTGRRLKALKTYLFETVLKNNSVAALFDIGALRSDDPHKATKCIYWYKLIKAQRNLSNHAVDTNGDADFDMTAEELRKTISIYLDLIRPEDKDESTEETTTVKM